MDIFTTSKDKYGGSFLDMLYLTHNKGIYLVLWEFHIGSSLFKGELHPRPKLACVALYLKIVNILVQNNVYVLKQIVQETQKWHLNFSRPIGS